MTTMYAPETPERVHRIATLAVARMIGSEAVTTRAIAEDRIDRVVAYEVIGTHAHGYAILGRSWLVAVDADGTATISDDEED